MLFPPRFLAPAAHSDSQRDQVAEFRRLVGQAGRDVEITDEEAAGLLSDVGWSPEAMKLAALATPTRSISSIRAALLAGPSDDAPRGPVERLVDLGRNAYEASESVEREAWTSLAIFSGWFDLEQARSVLEDSNVADPEQTLSGLVVRGIVTANRNREPIGFRLPALYRGAASAAEGTSVEVRARARASLRAWWIRRARAVDTEWFGSGGRELFRSTENNLETLEVLISESHPDDRGDVIEIIALLEPFWNRSGRTDLAVRLLEAAFRTGEPSTEQRFTGYRALAWLTSSFDVVTAEKYLALAEELVPELGDGAPLARARLDRMVGLIALYRGDATSARVMFERALAFDALGSDDGQTYIDLSFLAAAVSLEGDQRVAYDYCERAIAMCERHGETWLKNYTLWAFALTAWRDGDRYRAYVLALDGVESAIEINDPYVGAICLEIAGWYEVAQGDVGVGARILGLADSLRVAVAIPTLFWGSKQLHDEAVRDAISKLGPGAFHSAFRSVGDADMRDGLSWLRSSYDDGVDEESADGVSTTALTPRQREIAFLITEGRSNKEIARLLLITVRTVETHIEHIFGRLGVASRAQIAAWNARQAPRSHHQG